MRVSHLLLRKHVARALIFSDLVDIGIDAELVERTTEEHYVGSEPVDEQLAGWRHDDLVACRRDVILLVESKLDVRVNRFPGRTEISDRVANLFRLAPTNA